MTGIEDAVLLTLHYVPTYVSLRECRKNETV